MINKSDTVQEIELVSLEGLSNVHPKLAMISMMNAQIIAKTSL